MKTRTVPGLGVDRRTASPAQSMSGAFGSLGTPGDSTCLLGVGVTKVRYQVVVSSSP